MATFNKFQPFVERLAEKVFNLGSDQLAVALCNVAPNATDGQLSQLTEIAYTFLSSRNLTTSSSAQTSGTYKLVIADLVLTATGGTVGPFRYVVIYDDTATNKDLICYFDYGSSISLLNGETLTIDFDAANGLLQVA